MHWNSKLRRWLAPVAGAVAIAGGALVIGGATVAQAETTQDLTITKTADAVSVSPGSPIGFTVTLTNPSEDSVSDVVVDDPLPGGSGISWSVDSSSATTWPSGDCAIVGTAPSQELQCQGAGGGYTLAANSSVAVHVTSATTSASCGTFYNKAYFGDSLAGDNDGTLNGFYRDEDRSAHAVTNVNCLTITKTATDGATVDAGSPVGFTITLSNPGTEDAYGVTISDPLPAGYGIDWTRGTETGPASCWVTGSVPTQSLDCAPFTLDAGDSETVAVTSTTGETSCGTLDNTATYDALGFEKYVSGTLNTSVAPLSGSASASETVACLTLTKTADAASVSAGSTIGFTVTLANVGDGYAEDTTLTDPLPTGTGINWSIAGQSGPATCTITAGALSCGNFTLQPSGNEGSTETVHLTSPTTLASCDPYNNTASYATTYGAPPIQGTENVSEGPDTLTLNGSASATSTVTCPAPPTPTSVPTPTATATGSTLAASTPSTGAGPTSSVSLLGVVLLLLGGFAFVVALVAERRNRSTKNNLENI